MNQTGSAGGSVDPGAGEASYILSATMPGVANFFTIVFNIMIIVLGWWSILVEVFLRYDFGERYLSWLRLFFAFGILLNTGWWLRFFSAIGGGDGAPAIFQLFVLAVFILSILHRVRIWLRYQNGTAWHSMSFGTSRLSSLNLPVIGSDDWTLYRWYEPFLCLVLALIISRLDQTTGIVIGIGSIALLLKNHMVYYQQRGRILDLIDAKIESIYYNEAAYQKPKADIAGMAVVKVVWPKLPAAPSSVGDIAQTVNAALGKAPPPPPPAASSPSPTPDDFAATIAKTMQADKDE